MYWKINGIEYFEKEEQQIVGVVGVRVYYLSAAREVIRDVCFRQVAVKVALRLAVQNHDFF